MLFYRKLGVQRCKAAEANNTNASAIENSYSEKHK